MEPLDVPDWRNAYQRLLIASPLDGEIFLLPVAGKRFDNRNDYSRLFFRDSILSAFLINDDAMLGNVLRYFAAHQGRKPEAYTSEEPGKIPHEIPGVALRRYNTLYAACDTTALFLVGCASYAQSDSFDEETWKRLVPRMAAALGYLRAHGENGLFLEDPALSGARNFSLKATYWRDYGIPGRRARTLQYPAAFLLVQAQVIAAFRALLRLTGRGLFPGDHRRLDGELRAAREAFRVQFDCGDMYLVARDSVMRGANGVFSGSPLRFACTDRAHALWYLDPDDVSAQYRDHVREALSLLETPYGWKTWLRDPSLAGMGRLPEWLWPFEHAFVTEGLRRHGMLTSALHEIAMRPARFLIGCDLPFAEYVNLPRGKAVLAGCHIQLWTAAYWAWIEQTHR